MTRRSKQTDSRRAGGENPSPAGSGQRVLSRKLNELPSTGRGTLLLFNKVSGRMGPGPTQEQLQQWAAPTEGFEAMAVLEGGYASSLLAQHNVVVPSPEGELLYTKDAIAALVEAHNASETKPDPPSQPAGSPSSSSGNSKGKDPCFDQLIESSRLPKGRQVSLLSPDQILSTITTSIHPRRAPIMADLEEEQKKKAREIEELQAQLTTAREQLTVLEGTNSRLEERLSGNDSTVSELQRIISNQEGKIQQQESNARQREQELSHRDEQIRLQEATLGELNEKIGELEGDVSTLKDDLRSERKSFALEKDHNQREVGNLKDEIAKRGEEFDNLAQRLEKEQYNLSQERTAHQTAREFLEEVRQTNTTYKDQIIFQQGKISELEEAGNSSRNMKKQNDALLDEQESFSVKVKALEEEVENLQEQLEASHGQLKEKNDEYDSLRTESRALRSRIDEMDIEKSRFDRDRLNFQTQVTTLQAQLAERSKAIDTEDTGLFTPPPPTPPPLNRMNSLADELSGQSDDEEEDEEDGNSLAETVNIDMIEHETQTDPEPIVEPPSLKSSVLTIVSSEPLDAPAPPEPIIERLTPSGVRETVSSVPVAVTPPSAPIIPKPVALPVAHTKSKSWSPISNPYDTLWYLGATLISLLLVLMASQTIEYQAFNSPSPSTPLRILHATASPVISVFHAFPSARVLPIGFSNTPLSRAGSHGMGSWAGGLVPVGFTESYLDPGYMFGEWMIWAERVLGVDRGALT
ncbi:hypothetical protein EJ05DRAFT_485132 [Pseudovirgaria hyperparasitica]|uniref:Uncharacterized protein n=1 Tax=Pseudovirgaria hyperparasitica TaxID=470096 RepID=A0A6A6WAJ2_9PEZI|nr:uncharacterized protein EJ05DRAFT_485132 [Pseudovirgaria hyperparasitica]KAF2759054.1 hypothetical protein EJ05DRAFT_485132 [Pseudovirgaria hyperparasitica]